MEHYHLLEVFNLNIFTRNNLVMRCQVNISNCDTSDSRPIWFNFLSHQCRNTNGTKAFYNLAFLPIGMSDAIDDFSFIDKNKIIDQIFGNIKDHLVIQTNAAPQMSRPMLTTPSSKWAYLHANMHKSMRHAPY